MALFGKPSFKHYYERWLSMDLRCLFFFLSTVEIMLTGRASSLQVDDFSPDRF